MAGIALNNLSGGFIAVVVVVSLIVVYFLWLCVSCLRGTWYPPNPIPASGENIAPRKASMQEPDWNDDDHHRLSGSTIFDNHTHRQSQTTIVKQSSPPRPRSSVITTPLRALTRRSQDNPDIELGDMEPFEHQHFRENPGNYMTMGLRKLDIQKWLLLDKTYRDYYSSRDYLLHYKNNEVIQCLDEGYEAAVELLEEVVIFLTQKYPNHFRIVYQGDQKMVQNRIVKREYGIEKPFDLHPLEICARLAMEDFNLLMKNGKTGQHHLVGSATLFPAGWRLPERIGVPITQLHEPVPQWKDLSDIVSSSYFSRIRDSSCMERSSFFIQTRPLHKSLADILFIQDPKDFFAGSVNNLNPGYIMVRRERQTFRRLPRTGAIVFTVKTALEPVVGLAETEKRNLAREIRAWPEDIALYKGIGVWGTPLLRYLDGLSPEVEDVTVYGQSTVAGYR